MRELLKFREKLREYDEVIYEARRRIRIAEIVNLAIFVMYILSATVFVLTRIGC